MTLVFFIYPLPNSASSSYHTHTGDQPLPPSYLDHCKGLNVRTQDTNLNTRREEIRIPTPSITFRELIILGRVLGETTILKHLSRVTFCKRNWHLWSLPTCEGVSLYTRKTKQTQLGLRPAARLLPGLPWSSWLLQFLNIVSSRWKALNLKDKLIFWGIGLFFPCVIWGTLDNKLSLICSC